MELPRTRVGCPAGRWSLDPYRRHELRYFNGMQWTEHAAGISRGILGRLVATENLLLTAIGIPIGLVAGIGIARWFMSNYENLGYRWELRVQPSTVMFVLLAIVAASVVAQWSTWRGLKRIDIATIVRERSL